MDMYLQIVYFDFMVWELQSAHNYYPTHTLCYSAIKKTYFDRHNKYSCHCCGSSRLSVGLGNIAIINSSTKLKGRDVSLITVPIAKCADLASRCYYIALIMRAQPRLHVFALARRTVAKPTGSCRPYCCNPSVLEPHSRFERR